MLKIDRKNQSFSILEKPTLSDVSITERYDLQEFISNTPEPFFKELGFDLFLLGKEIEPSNNVQDRIDLLAVDKEGSCVVIELKRGNNKLHMLQAISYAGMLSQWEADDFLQLLDDGQQEALSEFLEVDREEINRRQRIILIAEGYDYALLVAAEWLCEQYGVDITCCRIAVAKDASTNSEYLVCSNVYPAPELVKEAVSRGRKHIGIRKEQWTDWKTALGSISNPSVITYIEKEIASNRESSLRKRMLIYRIAGKRRWFLAARNKNAYVWQYERFEGDVEFWKNALSDPEVVKPVKDGQCLRLFLESSKDFEFFHEAATRILLSKVWHSGTPDNDMEEEEPDSER